MNLDLLLHLISVGGKDIYWVYQTSSESGGLLSGSVKIPVFRQSSSLLRFSLLTETQLWKADKHCNRSCEFRDRLILTISPSGNARFPHINLDLMSHLISVRGLSKCTVHQTSSESRSSLSGSGYQAPSLRLEEDSVEAKVSHGDTTEKHIK